MDRATDEERRAELAAFLRAHSEPIVAAWERAVLEVPAARRMDTPALRDHIPALLEHLADRADGARSSKQEREAPKIHAVHRLERGFKLEELAREYTLLRTCILACLAEEQGPSLHVKVVELVTLVIDEAIARAIGTFTRARHRTLEALDRIAGASLAEHASPDRLLERVIEVFAATTPAIDSAVVALLEGDRLYTRAAVGIEEEVASGFSVAIGEGFTGTIAASRAPLLLRSASDDPRVSPAIRARGTRLLYGVPLVVGKALLGVACIGSSQNEELSEDDMVLFRTTAARAADTLGFTLASLRERAAASAARAFGASDTLDEGVGRLLEALGADLGWDVGAYWTFDAEAQVLRCRLRWSAGSLGGESALLARDARTTFAPGQGLPGQTWSTGVPHAVADVATDSDFTRAAAARADGLQSGLAFPLRAGEEPLGVVELFSRAARSPLGEATQLTVAIAGRAGEFVRRVVAQERAEVSQAFNAAVLEAARDAIVSMDPDGLVTGWNPAAERTFGYPREAAIGRTMAELIIPPRLREAHWAGLARYLATGQGRFLDRRVEVPAIRADGSELPVELTVTRVPVPGRPAFTGHLRDLTERLRVEEEVRRSHHAVEEARAMLDGLVTKAPVGIAFLDRELRYVRVNERLAESNGIEAAAHLGRKVTDVLPGETGRALNELLQHVLQTGEPVMEHALTGTKPGEPEQPRHWIASFYPVPGPDGSALGIGGIVADVTERKALEQTRERFVGILGHDLRNPLSAIDLGAQFLADSELPEREQEVVRRIASSAARMRAMVADLLDFARGRLGGGIPLNPAPVELESVVTRIVRELELAQPGREVRVETRGDLRGVWDADRLGQVISNLLSNALRYGAAGRAPEVLLDGRDRESVVVCVNNEADCPPAIDLAQLFDPFRRGGERTRKPSEGLGLGLYITREVVHAHGGRIDVSCSDEEGFTLSVHLPRGSSAASQLPED